MSKGQTKNTKDWIPGELKELFQWNKKTLFIVFEGLSFGVKIKIWEKIADTSFKFEKKNRMWCQCFIGIWQQHQYFDSI